MRKRIVGNIERGSVLVVEYLIRDQEDCGFQRKNDGKDQESIQSSATSDPG